VIGNGTVPVLVTVTALTPLVVLMVWLPKLIDAGDAVNVGTISVPVSETDCAVAGAPTFTVNVAVFVTGFADVGAKVTLIVQLAPAASAAPQVFVCVNWFELLPPSEILLITRDAVPGLLSITACGALGTFSAVRSVSDAGETDAADAIPVPLKVTVCGLVGSESTIESAAARAPAALGLNLRLIAQLRPAARFVPQLLVRRKSPAFAPPIVPEFMVRGVLPVFRIVTV
jgi:hypothetical protein